MKAVLAMGWNQSVVASASGGYLQNADKQEPLLPPKLTEASHNNRGYISIIYG